MSISNRDNDVLAMIKTTLTFLKTTRDRMFMAEIKSSHPSVQGMRVPVILFVATILFYVAYQFAMEPGWMLGGEMWAEMGTNYFPNANSPSYLQRLIATDSGYIPAPQRLIAFAGNVFNLPASSIPYFYTWSATIITGLMVGAFCLPQFRIMVRSDALRFFTAIAILVVADFGTRVFNNFTYFGAFFVAITTALALVDDSEQFPWWAWFIPVLLVSKPAVIAAFPAMMVASTVGNPRFRRITIVTAVLVLGQLVQMIISQKSGAMSQSHEFTFLSKLIATDQYFFGLLCGYIVGPEFHLGKTFSMLAGILFVSAIGLAIYEFRSKANALIIVGLSLLFFNVLLNSFALSDSWNRDMIQLAEYPTAHIIVGFFGCIMVVVGLLSNLSNIALSKLTSTSVNAVAAVAFASWFVGAGWLSLGQRISKEPSLPWINNSQWQNMANAIDAGISPLCVPINPMGWVYSRDCTILNQYWPQHLHFERVQSTNDIVTLELTPPASLSEKTLVALGVMARPLSTRTTFVSVSAIINLNNGSRKYYMGNQDLMITGGLILLTGKDIISMKNISSIKFVFSAPVEVALTTNDQNGTSAILWMGS